MAIAVLWAVLAPGLSLSSPVAFGVPVPRFRASGQGEGIELTDPAGNFIEDTFDALNRNMSREVTLVSGFHDTTAESRSFDALNRLTENEDDDYRATSTYSLGSQTRLNRRRNRTQRSQTAGIQRIQTAADTQGPCGPSFGACGRSAPWSPTPPPGRGFESQGLVGRAPVAASDGPRKSMNGGSDGTRTRDLRLDRPAL